MAKQNSNSNTEFFLAMFVIISLAGYTWWEKIGRNEFESINWTKVGIIITGIVSLIFIIYLLYYTYNRIKQNLKTKREEQEYLEKEEGKLLETLETDFDLFSSKKAKLELQKIRNSLKYLPSTLNTKYQNEISNFYKKTNKLIKEKEIEEEIRKIETEKWIKEQAELKQKEEERIKREHNKKVAELFAFKKGKNSIKALPLNKIYPNKVINEATWLMRKHLKEIENEKLKIEEAKEYYKEHDLDSKPRLTSCWEEEIYRQVRNDIKEGKIELKKKPEIEYLGKKLDKDFYRTKELDEETKLRAKAQGFKYTRGVELNGLVRGGGFYIRKENPRESSYHFYMKHLFAELHPNMRIEHQIGDKRVDVVLFIDGFKLGIEVETGVNKIEHLATKLPWLNKHFDQWIFVCPRKYIPRYNKLVDHEKSFCFAPKKAKEHILELLAPEEQL